MGEFVFNLILVDGFVVRIKANMMTLEQVPIPYKKAVRIKLEKSDN